CGLQRHPIHDQCERRSYDSFDSLTANGLETIHASMDNAIGTSIYRYSYDEVRRIGRMDDEISRKILELIRKASEPLETKEIERRIREEVANATRPKVMYRLNDLRGQGRIRGKYVGPGKGVWIWWKRNAFEK
ncbi:MAG: hypothetical protein ACE5KV_06700, partial [Thermoplasmata archaeon]